MKLKSRKNKTGEQVGEKHQRGQGSFSPKVFFFVAFLCCLLFQNLYGQAPTITAFTPANGPVGTVVTITGTNFNTTSANNIVFFGATQATVTAATATQLTVTVPTGATYAPINVLNTSTSLLAYSTTSFTPTFSPNKGSITTSDFEPKVDFTTGTDPYSVAIGDLDGDGKADLAVANPNSGTVSVFRNTSNSGTISYATKVDFTTGAIPVSVAIGDLDGDGKADLAVANQNSASVSIFRNTGSSGTISYATKVDFTTGSNPKSVAIGDLDGDGKADLAVANNYSFTVSVLRNTGSSGTINYATKVDFTTGSFPWSVAIGNLDGDGKTDLAVANYGSTSVSVFRNTGSSGTINYATKVDFTTGIYPYYVAIGDLDGDGKADLVVANGIFRNTGSSGTISYTTKVDFTTSANSFAIGDLDGDGKADLAVVNQSYDIVSVFRNTGSSGTISYATNVDFTTGSNPTSVAIGDLDGDGKADLAVANGGSNTVSIIRNNPFFSVLPPTITSFTPASGPAGTTVTITGTNFSTTPANNTVAFNGTTAVATASTATSITTTVPAGATTGKITVTVGGNTATSATDFVVTAPGGAITINTETLGTSIGGTITKDLVPLITTLNNNLDINSIAIIAPPPSGAPASVSNGILTVDYTNIAFSGRESITIRACDADGNCTTQPFEIEIAGDILVYNAISPDGKNPVFRLEYIDLFPDTQKNTVYIYSRWGDEVFSATDYDNVTSVFRGLSSSGNKLPSGTYFYKVLFASGRKTMTGYLELRY